MWQCCGVCVNKRRSDSRNLVVVWKLVILAIAVCLNITLAVRLIWGPQSVLSYRELRTQQVALETELAAQETHNALLSREIRLLQSDERYVEKIIRQRLNYVKENEILYLFDTGQSAAARGAEGNERKN